MIVLRLSYCKDCLYMFWNLSQAIALKFQSTLIFRWQHVMWGMLLGLVHPSQVISSLGTFISHPALYHSALHSFKALTFRPPLQGSSDITWYQKTSIGIVNIIIRTWTAWFCWFPHMEIRYSFLLVFISYISEAKWLPGGGADVLLLLRSCVMSLSTLEWEAVWFWQAGRS